MTTVANNNLLIRADANSQIGTGHLMRCLALAQAWQDRGGKVVFITACESGVLRKRLVAEGFQVISIEKPCPALEDWERTSQVLAQYPRAWVVLDGYHFDSLYQLRIKETGHPLLVIDDMAHLEHYYADIVLNQNLHARDLKYSCEPYTRLLLGTKYVLLRREFLKWQGWKREIPEIARKVLVTLGGADPDNVTLKVIEALQQIGVDGLEAVVIAGMANPHLEGLRSVVRNIRFPIHLETCVNNMPRLISWADVAIIAAGGTLWELLFMGCPAISYARNEFQSDVLEMLAKDDIVLGLGSIYQATSREMAAAIEKVMRCRSKRWWMSLSGELIIDGKGASRAIEAISGSDRGCRHRGSKVYLRPINLREKQQFLEMATHYYKELNPAFVPHEHWKERFLESILSDSNMFLRWITVDQEKIGFVLYGLRPHRYMPVKIGWIYEIYVQSNWRGLGLGRECVWLVINEMRRLGVSKIQLEVIVGNERALEFWQKLGFIKVSDRFHLEIS